MPKTKKRQNNFVGTKSSRNDIDNKLVWVEVVGQELTDTDILLAQSDGSLVYTIVNNDCENAVEHRTYTEKRFCPFCNPVSRIEHKICEVCAESIIHNTQQCFELCQYPQRKDCECRYCKKLRQD